jgi:hypothetical protein
MVKRLSDAKIFTIKSSKRRPSATDFLNPPVNHTLDDGSVVDGDDNDYELVSAGKVEVVVAPAEEKITITPAQVKLAVDEARTNPFRAQYIANSFYWFKITEGGVSLNYRDGQEFLSTIKWGKGDNKMAKVEEMNTKKGYEGNGFAKLVATAFIADAKHQGCTSLTLGTNDTSGGFWKNIGLQIGATPIDTVLSNILSIKVTKTPIAKEFEETDRTKNTGLY